jgi:hypothetical protein
MRNTIKRIIEFIKFVIGSIFMCVGVIVGGIAGFVVKVSNLMVRTGIIWASDLRSRYLEIDNPRLIDRKTTIVQEESSN